MNEEPQSYCGDDTTASQEAVVSIVRECELHYIGAPIEAPRVRSSRDVEKIARDIIPYGPREHFIALFLDTKSRPVGFYRIQGAISSAAVDVRDVYSIAIRSCASSWIAIHNHPSDDPSPSHEDIALSARLERAGELIGIRMLDFVIIAPGVNTYSSFLDQGLIERER